MRRLWLQRCWLRSRRERRQDPSQTTLQRGERAAATRIASTPCGFSFFFQRSKAPRVQMDQTQAPVCRRKAQTAVFPLCPSDFCFLVRQKLRSTHLLRSLDAAGGVHASAQNNQCNTPSTSRDATCQCLPYICGSIYPPSCGVVRDLPAGRRACYPAIRSLLPFYRLFFEIGDDDPVRKRPPELFFFHVVPEPEPPLLQHTLVRPIHGTTTPVVSTDSFFAVFSCATNRILLCVGFCVLRTTASHLASRVFPGSGVCNSDKG